MSFFGRENPAMSQSVGPVVSGTPAAQRPAVDQGQGKAWSGAFAGGALGLLLALILAVAALAATVIGLLVAFAAIVARLAPRRRPVRADGPPLLEGRARADGWVVEQSSPSAR
jgi:uncharacterized integral membrane protein